MGPHRANRRGDEKPAVFDDGPRPVADHIFNVIVETLGTCGRGEGCLAASGEGGQQGLHVQGLASPLFGRSPEDKAVTSAQPTALMGSSSGAWPASVFVLDSRPLAPEEPLGSAGPAPQLASPRLGPEPRFYPSLVNIKAEKGLSKMFEDLRLLYTLAGKRFPSQLQVPKEGGPQKQGHIGTCRVICQADPPGCCCEEGPAS